MRNYNGQAHHSKKKPTPLEAPRGVQGQGGPGSDQAAALGIAWEDVDAKYRTLVPRAGVSERLIEASLAVIHGFRDVNDVSKVIDLLRA